MIAYIRTILSQIDESLTGKWPTPGQYAIECPAGWQTKTLKAKPPKVNRENVYAMDEETNTFGFRDRDFNGPSGNTANGQGVPHLTEYDYGLLQDRFGTLSKKSLARAEDTKECWHKGLSKEEASEQLQGMGHKASVSWVEKLYGTYSTALETEMSVA